MNEACLALAPVLGLAADCLAHVACCWWYTGHHRLAGFAAAFLAGLALTLAAGGFALSGMNLDRADAVAQLLLISVSYAALAYGYYNFVGLNFSSLRIRLLQEILLADGSLTRSEVEHRYGTEEIVQRRLDRLQGSGQLVERDGRFYLGKRLLLIVARVNDIVRFCVLGTMTAPRQNRADDHQMNSVATDDKLLTASK